MTEEEKNILEKPISKEEIEKAIDQTKMGKAPGSDSFTAKCYMIFKSDITDWFQIVANDVLENIPQTWQNAIISMIPKQVYVQMLRTSD